MDRYERVASMGYGVIGSPTVSGSVSLGSSPGTPADQAHPASAAKAARPAVGRPASRQSDPAAPVAAPGAAALVPGSAHQQQHQKRTDDRADDARKGELVRRQPVVEEQVLQESTDEGTRHAQQDRAPGGRDRATLIRFGRRVGFG